MAGWQCGHSRSIGALSARNCLQVVLGLLPGQGLQGPGSVWFLSRCGCLGEHLCALSFGSWGRRSLCSYCATEQTRLRKLSVTFKLDC